ncbi:MAG: outer membrane beta-barrel family protein, partial [Saprospiraceae bacterium]|nr:outer membrane beta-barrel family protein [Saprospiraceae bacterium]
LKWEVGYQFRYLKHPGDFTYLDRDLENNTWVENPLFTNAIDLRRSIHAGYAVISQEVDRWQYDLGLRLEHFDRTVDIARPTENYKLSGTNLFPTLNVRYALADDLSIRAGYSRRIERTTTFKMTPFPEREHSETLEQGDAELLPEYIDLVELGMTKYWGEHSLSITGFYRHVDNAINRVNTIFNDTILNRIYTNVGTAEAQGVEVSTTIYPTNWARINLGGSIFDYHIKGRLFDDEISTSSTQYSLSTNLALTVSPSLDVQFAFNYLSDRITAQGEDSRFYNPSLTIRKSFLDDRLAVVFQWLNMDLGLLSSNEQRITTVRRNFFTTTNYVYEVDIVQLNVTYQINARKFTADLPESEFGKREF